VYYFYILTIYMNMRSLILIALTAAITTMLAAFVMF
jgi:hypothetical protein